MTYEQAKEIITERLELAGIDQTEEQIAEMAAVLVEVGVEDYRQLKAANEWYKAEPGTFRLAITERNRDN